MARFALNSNSVFTLDSNSIPCLTSADTNETIDAFLTMCAGDAYKSTVTGKKQATITLNFEINNNDVTFLNDFAVGASGAMLFQPNGTTAGDISYSSTNATVVDRSESYTTSGFGTGTVTINLDNLTIAANGA